MLTEEELIDVENVLLEQNYLEEILRYLNESDRINEFLELVGLETFVHDSVEEETKDTGKIVVIGNSSVKVNWLIGISETLGISRERLVFYDYREAQKLNYKNMQYNPAYALVLFGPIGHSAHDKGKYGSIISAVEQEAGYPPAMRLGKNGLKITRSEFRDKMMEAIRNGFIHPDMTREEQLETA